jgi:hypothetical protein
LSFKAIGGIGLFEDAHDLMKGVLGDIDTDGTEVADDAE